MISDAWFRSQISHHHTVSTSHLNIKVSNITWCKFYILCEREVTVLLVGPVALYFNYAWVLALAATANSHRFHKQGITHITLKHKKRIKSKVRTIPFVSGFQLIAHPLCSCQDVSNTSINITKFPCAVHKWKYKFLWHNSQIKHLPLGQCIITAARSCSCITAVSFVPVGCVILSCISISGTWRSVYPCPYNACWALLPPPDVTAHSDEHDSQCLWCFSFLL